MRAAPALVGLAMLAAGCTVEAPEFQQGPGAGPAGLEPNPAGVPPAGNGSELVVPEAPSWQLRQWWRVRGFGQGFDRTDTRVVTADQGSAWLLQTNDPEVAYFDARFDITTVGQVRKADLAGLQRGQPVEFYRFPLAANSTWSTTWDGQPRTIHVLGPQPANVGGRTLPALLLEGRQPDGQPSVRYNYVPEVMAWSFMEFLGPQGSFRLDLQAFGQQYNGTVAEARVQELYRDEASGTLEPSGSFSVGSGVGILEASLLLRGDTVHHTLAFTRPDNQAAGPFTHGPCTANCTFQQAWRLAPLPGEWRLAASGVLQGGAQTDPEAVLTVHAATVTERTIA